MSIKTSSAKAKGRNLQNWVVQMLINMIGADPEDVQSNPMGSSGEDVIMGTATRKLFPYSVECKHHAKIGVYKFYEQAKANAGDYEPLVVIKQNRSKQLVVVDAEHFLSLVNCSNSHA